MEKKTRVQLMGAAAVVVAVGASAVIAQTSTLPSTAILGTAYGNSNGDTDTDSSFSNGVNIADGKGIENVVTVTATYAGPDGNATATDDNVTVKDTAFENVDVVSATPGVQITKTASKTENAAADEVITYTYRVRNSGNVTLVNVGIEDQHYSAAGIASTQGWAPLTLSSCAPITATSPTFNGSAVAESKGIAAVTGTTITSLPPNEIVDCTSTYTVKQADVDTLQKAAETSGSPAVD